MKKPLLAITMGDPAGVGPEIIVKAWADPRVHEACQPVVFGHPQVLEKAVTLLEAAADGSCADGYGVNGHSVGVVVIDDLTDLAKPKSSPNTIVCLPFGEDDLLDVPHGTVDARTGQASFDAIVQATDAALAGDVQGIVTAPISKSALHAAGHTQYPGHTELLADRCGIDDFAMMLYLPPDEVPACPAGLGVVHVTLHMALSEVFENMTAEAVAAKCGLAHRVMRDGFGLESPRVGVCALNPHGGEAGLFGDEEITTIAPAVAQAQADGINAQGPFPTDTLMGRARNGEFDAVVAMYHDQGHIALKLLGMHRAVNITLGLPIVRTSVAHGTAFDRAWQGSAESSGMVAALVTAAKLAKAGDTVAFDWSVPASWTLEPIEFNSFADAVLQYCDNCSRKYPDSQKNLANLRKHAEQLHKVNQMSESELDEYCSQLSVENKSEGTGFNLLFQYVSALSNANKS